MQLTFFTLTIKYIKEPGLRKERGKEEWWVERGFCMKQPVHSNAHQYTVSICSNVYRPISASGQPLNQAKCQVCMEY